MSGQERTPYQERAIKNYYKNRDALMVQKLQEMVGDLYLAEGKKRERLWKRVETALENIGTPRKQIDHILASDNPSILANYVKGLIG